MLKEFFYVILTIEFIMNMNMFDIYNCLSKFKDKINLYFLKII